MGAKGGESQGRIKLKNVTRVDALTNSLIVEDNGGSELKMLVSSLDRGEIYA